MDSPTQTSQPATVDMLKLTRPHARASTKALGVAEILENILNSLPNKDILRCMRVSTFFHAVVEGSLKIQRSLFRIPSPWKGPQPKWDAELVDPKEHDVSGYPIVSINPILLLGSYHSHDDIGDEVSIWFSFNKKRIQNHKPVSRMALTSPVVPGMDVMLWVRKDPRIVTWYPLELGANDVTLADVMAAEAEEIAGWMGKDYKNLKSSDCAWCAIFPRGLKFEVLGKKYPGAEAEEALEGMRMELRTRRHAYDGGEEQSDDDGWRDDVQFESDDEDDLRQ